MDIFDTTLGSACQRSGENEWALPCDLPGNEARKSLVLQVLHFTALLIEHSFTRHLYSSMEHLTTLLSSSDMTVVLGVLNLLYVFRYACTVYICGFHEVCACVYRHGVSFMLIRRVMLFYLFSKRSNFITRLNADQKQALVIRLTHLGEVCLLFMTFM